MPISNPIEGLLPGTSTHPVIRTAVSDTVEHEVEKLELLEETARVEKRQVETGNVKVYVTVSERDQAIETLLKRQDVVIDRIRLDQPVDAAPPTRQEGDTIIVSIVEERVVVEKRLFVTEELRIRIDQSEHLETQTVRLRREQAQIDEHASPIQTNHEDLK